MTAGPARLPIALLVLAWVFVTLGGCGASRGQARQDKPLPKLTDLAGRDGDETGWIRDSGMLAVARVTRIWLPAGQPDEDWWRKASHPALSESELHAWRENHLRAAVTLRADLPALLETLPGHLGVNRQWLTLSTDLTPLDAASSQAASQPTWIIQAGQPHLHRHGKMQWLMATDLLTGPAVKLTLVPHLHQPQTRLLPRSHLAAALDGLIFTDLMLRVRLEPGQVLLLSSMADEPGQDDADSDVDHSVNDAAVKAGSAGDERNSPTAGKGEAMPADVEDQPAPSADPADPPQALPSDSSSAAPSPVMSSPVTTAGQPMGRALLGGAQIRTELHQLLIIEVAQLSTSQADGQADSQAQGQARESQPGQPSRPTRGSGPIR